MEIINSTKEKPLLDELAKKQVSRRKFMSWAGILGASASVAIVGASCKKDDNDSNNNGGVNLGSGDVGILNYAYALEQLEAAFYTQVATAFYTGATDTEKTYLQEIRDHEIAHREFFKKALAGDAIQDLEVDFSSINFASKDSVLATAKTFEDLGVAAYNGAGKLLTNATFLLIAGKIVSVEARHAALIRDLITNGSFADLNSLSAFGANNTNGLDGALMPADVLSKAAPFIKTKINASNLPTS